MQWWTINVSAPAVVRLRAEAERAAGVASRAKSESTAMPRAAWRLASGCICDSTVALWLRVMVPPASYIDRSC